MENTLQRAHRLGYRATTTWNKERTSHIFKVNNKTIESALQECVFISSMTQPCSSMNWVVLPLCGRRKNSLYNFNSRIVIKLYSQANRHAVAEKRCQVFRWQDDGNKNPTNLHIWQWKIAFLHALHKHSSSFHILKTFSFFLRREMTCFAVLCGRREHMMTNVTFCLLVSEALVPIYFQDS